MLNYLNCNRTSITSSASIPQSPNCVTNKLIPPRPYLHFLINFPPMACKKQSSFSIYHKFTTHLYKDTCQTTKVLRNWSWKVCLKSNYLPVLPTIHQVVGNLEMIKSWALMQYPRMEIMFARKTHGFAVLHLITWIWTLLEW